MTPLTTSLLGAHRVRVDDAIDQAIARIESRMAPFGGAFADLGTAMRRSTSGGKRFRPALVVATFESLARATAAWPEVHRALTEARTGPIAVRRAQAVLDESGARGELERLVADALADARGIASTPVLPARTAALLEDLVRAVEARIP
jgi:hypothetical protein